MSHPHLVAPATKIDLMKLSTRGKDYHDDRDKAEREFKQLRNDLDEFQTRLFAEGRQKLLLVLQAMDGGGKDGTVRSVFKEVNPQGLRIVSFKVPTPYELSRDFLWRIHREVPGKGEIVAFNRSHYEDVVVVRVDQIVPEKTWRARFDQINQFEEYLTATGTRIVKCFLHISAEEQRERFEERLADPEKHWKFSLADLEKRKQWKEYMAAYSEAISRCSTSHAPWHIIPADNNWYRNWAVAELLVRTLKEMNPQYPDLAEEFKGAKVE